MSSRISALSFAVAACLAVTTLPAFACESDAECSEGEVCELVGMATCSSEEPDCETEIYECVAPSAPACQSDSDCPADGYCFVMEREECWGGEDVAVACAPGEDCPEPETMEETCETETTSVCLPTWLRECESDTECDEGFSCQAMQSVWECSDTGGEDVPPPQEGGPEPMPADESEESDSSSDSGSSEGSAPSDESDMPAEESEGAEVPAEEVDGEECVEVMTGPALCVPPEQSCATDSDCDSGFECVDELETCLPEGDWDWIAISEALAEGLAMDGEDSPTSGDYEESEQSASDENGSADDGTSNAPGDTGDDDREGCAAAGGQGSGGLTAMAALLGALLLRRRRT